MLEAFTKLFLDKYNPSRGHDHPAQAPYFKLLPEVDKLLSAAYLEYCNLVPKSKQPWSRREFELAFYNLLAAAGAATLTEA